MMIYCLYVQNFSVFYLHILMSTLEPRLINGFS